VDFIEEPYHKIVHFLCIKLKENETK
jgi:hypothetical protein